MTPKALSREEKLRKEYYDWQWKTYPSDEAGSFYPLRTNKEIADWWIAKLEEERNAALSEAIALSDLIESQNNTVFDEWRAFKQFRNTLRDKLKHE